MIINEEGNIQPGEELGKEGALTVFTKNYRLIDGNKKKLVERVSDGSIIKRFDKTDYPKNPSDVVCPHFLELKWANGCPFSCAWCYLQGTYRFLPTGKSPRLKDREKIGKHVEAFLDCNKGPPEILNSGELSDSLMTEKSKEPFSDFILEYFEKQKKHKILFLSKSNCVRNLVKIEENGQSIASFSLNAKNVADRWEKAPGIQARINAAAKVAEVGFETRIRIDPMVPYGDWKTQYFRLIDEIFNQFKPERITIGSLRGLQSTINNSKDKTWVNYLGEYSNWGRKIPFEQRYEMYKTIIDYMKSTYKYKRIALCKETIEMWKKLNMDFHKIKCNCII
jgi:spore photoproduct lyase